MPVTKNEKRRLSHLESRKTRYIDLYCLTCSIRIAESIRTELKNLRVTKYCRYCIEAGDARKHRWRAYYKRNRKLLLPKLAKRAKVNRFREATKPPVQITKSMTLSQERIQYLRQLAGD